MQTAHASQQGTKASGGVVWDKDWSCWSVSDSFLVRHCLQADSQWLSSNFVTFQEGIFQSAGLGCPRDLIELSENVLTQQDGCYHDHIRAAVSPTFNRLVKAARPAFQNLVDTYASRLDDSFDLVTDLADPVARGALAIVLDLPTTQEVSLVARGLDVVEIFDYVPGLPAAHMMDRMQRARTALAEVSDFFEQKLLAHSLGTTPRGLTAALCEQRHQANGPLLSNLEIVWHLVTTLIAGYATTSSLISGALAQMACSPREMLADKAGFRTAFEDLIRQAAPTRYVMRYATADATLGGVEIRAGNLVKLCLKEANADAACLARSDPAAHLSFGEGMHACPGTSLAKLLLKTVIDSLAAHDIHPQPSGDPVTSNRFHAVSCQLSWAGFNRLHA